jgi:hypothetical protein
MAPLALAGAFLTGLVLGDALDYYPITILILIAAATAAACRVTPLGPVWLGLLASGIALGALAAPGPQAPIPPARFLTPRSQRRFASKTTWLSVCFTPPWFRPQPARCRSTAACA